MVASQVRASLISGLLVLGFASAAIPSLNHDQPKDNSVNEAPWIPATQPRDFSYNIQDGIQGASQIRQETWKNGTMNGLYAFPLGDGLWQMVTYIADEKGYRILSSKQVTEAEMLKGGAHADSDTASVDINRDGDKTAYKVTADEIFHAAKKNHTEEQAQKQRRGLYEAHQNASEAAFEARADAESVPEASESPLESRGSAPAAVPAHVNASDQVALKSRGVGPMPAHLNASSSAPMAPGDWPAGHMVRSAVMPLNASATMASGDWPAGPMTRSADTASNVSADMDAGDWPADMDMSKPARDVEPLSEDDQD